MAARGALLPSILDGDRYVVGAGVMQTTYQLGLIVGFPLGGLVVQGMGTQGALLLDAGTFVVSGLVVYWFVGARPASRDGQRAVTTWSSLTSGARLVWADPALKALLALACVSGLYIAPEGLVVPFSDQIGAGAIGVGLLLAANPLGTAIGMVVLSRFVTPERRLRLLGPLAVATSAMLLPTALVADIPWPLAWSLVWWTLAGLCSAHDMVTNTQFVTRVPDDARGQAVGLAVAGLRGAQGIGVLITGALAELVTPARVIALSAVVGVVAAWWAARAWQQATTPSPDQH
jgi:predicted MFS family arabinose efflux permease